MSAMVKDFGFADDSALSAGPDEDRAFHRSGLMLLLEYDSDARQRAKPAAGNGLVGPVSWGILRRMLSFAPERVM